MGSESLTEKVLDGMTEDEMELFILVQQSIIYKIRDEWEKEQEEAMQIRNQFEEKQRCANYTKKRLFSILQFLNQYNREACPQYGWFAELGFKEGEL